MKKITISLFIIIGFLNSTTAQMVKKVNRTELQRLMDTTRGPLVINFWASWCGPCVREIPWFEKTIKGMQAQKVKLILISLDFPDEYPAGIKNFVKRNGYQSDVYWLQEPDPEQFFKSVDAGWDGNIPVTMMLNNRKNYRRFYNQQIPEKKLQLALKELLD